MTKLSLHGTMLVRLMKSYQLMGWAGTEKFEENVIKKIKPVFRVRSEETSNIFVLRFSSKRCQ